MKRKYLFNTKQVLLTVVIAAVSLSGCKKFLDVNTNPNSPDSAAPNLLLPASQAATGQIMGNFFQINGNIWAQYWTQNPTSSQYRTVDQYNPAATASDRAWNILYRGALVNADLITKSNDAGIAYTRGIAHLMKAYTLQVTTDAFGDVPVKEALQSELFRNPHYDAQSVVYDSVFYNIDRGLALMNASASASPGAQDLVFSGSVANWKAFANTLRLKAGLRLAYIDAVKAKAQVQAAYTAAAVTTGGVTTYSFLTVDASIKYLSTGGNENPLYNEMVGLNRVQNIVASTTAVAQFDANSDPRVAKFYDLLPVDATAKTDRSIAQGTYAAGANNGKTVSPPSPLVGGRASNSASATAPVKFISAAESWFLQAEAVARNWAPAGQVLATLYTNGVRASFTSVGLTAGDADTYLGVAGNVTQFVTPLTIGTEEDKIKSIITQKYFAMCGFQGFEAWTEWRRTGYPTFFVKSAASVIGGVRMPLRMLYPATESTTNTNYPGLKVIYAPVWWDTKHPLL
ncbi:SusD/RagB family nutrient-binding outer membrane lipoprotein [Mucilaginibacter calamicampi]|uniref:SusD/RagB family nutrient-binding outer membrane lipoprotein n=1 Tax=Mucilaginibacter calamicampi TaxID=1302352 RepID=A0ABW2YX00_9SPHI